MKKLHVLIIALMLLFVFPTVMYATIDNTQITQQQQTTEKVKILKQSSTNSVVFGVCGGLGEYFNVDPVVFRIGFVAFSLLGGAGVLFYIITALLMTDA